MNFVTAIYYRLLGLTKAVTHWLHWMFLLGYQLRIDHAGRFLRLFILFALGLIFAKFSHAASTPQEVERRQKALNCAAEVYDFLTDFPIFFFYNVGSVLFPVLVSCLGEYHGIEMQLENMENGFPKLAFFKVSCHTRPVRGRDKFASPFWISFPSYAL